MYYVGTCACTCSLCVWSCVGTRASRRFRPPQVHERGHVSNSRDHLRVLDGRRGESSTGFRSFRRRGWRQFPPFDAFHTKGGCPYREKRRGMNPYKPSVFSIFSSLYDSRTYRRLDDSLQGKFVQGKQKAAALVFLFSPARESFINQYHFFSPTSFCRPVDSNPILDLHRGTINFK